MIASEVVYFQDWRRMKERVRLENRVQPALILLLVGCASSTPQVSAPTPIPAISAPSAATPSSWMLRLAPGATVYRISRSGVIENTSDSSGGRAVTANSSHETLNLEQLGDTIAFTAILDTFATTVQRETTSSQQPVALPFQLSGQVVADKIRISGDTLADKCNPAVTALVSDLHNLLPRFPVSLSVTSRWTDSTDVVGCQSSIPIRSRVTHSYSVTGEISYADTRVLVIQRLDSIRAEGEGAQQQHRVVLAAMGNGNATYYVDPISAHVVQLITNQDVELTVTASGRTNRFRQTARQEFTLRR